MIVLNSAATRKLLREPTKDIEIAFAHELAWAIKLGLSHAEAKLVLERVLEQALREAAPSKRAAKQAAVRVDAPKKTAKTANARMAAIT